MFRLPPRPTPTDTLFPYTTPFRSALLFGSSAIGGVVNVLDARIPRVVPEEAVHLEAIGSYGSAADERTASGAVDLPVGDKLVLHADGSYSKSGNLDTGGYILSPALRAEVLASGTPRHGGD